MLYFVVLLMLLLLGHEMRKDTRQWFNDQLSMTTWLLHYNRFDFSSFLFLPSLQSFKIYVYRANAISSNSMGNSKKKKKTNCHNVVVLLSHRYHYTIWVHCLNFHNFNLHWICTWKLPTMCTIDSNVLHLSCLEIIDFDAIWLLGSMQLGTKHN